jgi:UDP-glucuronate 4-epimerase
MKKNILIIGHLGFIGSKLWQKYYNDSKYNVYGYDLLEGDDIRNRMMLDKKIEAVQPDVVILLAAFAGVRRSKEYPEEYTSCNVYGTQNVVDMCDKYKVKKLVFYSSSSVIGGNYDLSKGLVEDDEYNPISLYAITKVAGEMIVKAGKTPYIIIRPFTVYGEAGRKDMVIYKWINEIRTKKPITFFGDGETQRGYTYRDDLVDATAELINQDISNETVHLGGSEVIKLKELLELFKRKCEEKEYKLKINKLPIPKGDVVSSFANTGKARSLIGFNPEPRFKKLINKILDEEL